MEQKTIPIKTTKERFFRQYLEILNPMINLRPKELDVLSQFMYYNYKYGTIDREYRCHTLFHRDTRKMIMGKLNMSEESFNNNMTGLRKAGAISKKGLKTVFDVHPNGKFNINFSFAIEKDIQEG